MSVIFVSVLLPVLVMVGLGVGVQRWAPMNLQTLTRLNLFLFVPAFLFVRVAESRLAWSEIIAMGWAVFIPMVLLGLPIYYGLKRFEARGATIAAVVVGGLFYNAGNFGIPVAELAYGSQGGAVQALVVMFMNTTIFFLGYLILSLAQGRGAGAAMGYFKLPMIYVIVAGLVVRDTGATVPAWLMEPIKTVAQGMVPIALITLGAQLAGNFRMPRWSLIGPVVLLKLAVMPVVTGGVVWALGLWPWPGAQLVLAAAAPTAVNTLLLSLELNGDAETTADCIFWTTLASTVSVTVVLWVLAYLGGVPPLVE